MEIQFRTKKLQRQYEYSNEAVRSFGKDAARKYIQRVNIIKHSKDIKELCSLPGLCCHPLKGKRKGQWAVRLTGFYRLIFTLKGSFLEIAFIEEVSKHYDE